MCRIVETTPSPRLPDAETDSAGEGTERRETTDLMSPDPDVAMDTSGVVPGEQDHTLDTEKIEIIASTLEEICTFLNQAQHLIVSGFLLYSCANIKLQLYLTSPSHPYPCPCPRPTPACPHPSPAPAPVPVSVPYLYHTRMNWVHLCFDLYVI